VLLAFFAGCILGSIIHLLRMRVSGAGKVLALGPYLAAGVFLSMLWGEQLLSWYLGKF
jgi:leader peptidase (prepilin peptidase)/N-methyltransferase